MIHPDSTRRAPFQFSLTKAFAAILVVAILCALLRCFGRVGFFFTGFGLASMAGIFWSHRRYDSAFGGMLCGPLGSGGAAMMILLAAFPPATWREALRLDFISDFFSAFMLVSAGLFGFFGGWFLSAVFRFTYVLAMPRGPVASAASDASATAKGMLAVAVVLVVICALTHYLWLELSRPRLARSTGAALHDLLR
jgi:hypothetical protein